MVDAKSPCLADKQCHTSERSSIARLPTELLITILLLALPGMDAMNDRKEGKEYMTQLYAFRLVSKHWRGVIDGAPMMWPLISSALPAHVNDASVFRSLNTPLVVIYDIAPRNEYRRWEPDRVRELQFDIAAAQNFMEWADVVRHRWASVTFKLAPSVASILLAKPASQLHSLTILLYLRSLANLPQINLLGGRTEQIRHVKIDRVPSEYVNDRCIPMFWPSGAFQGLKSLHLGHVCGASLTTRYILEVLSANPDLETLTLKSNAIQYNPSDMELPQVVLPCLRTLDYMPDHGVAIDQTLRHITLLPNSIKNLSITDSEHVSEQSNNRYEDFLTTVLISLAPALGRLHEGCGGSYLHLYPATQQSKAQVSWDGQMEDLRLRIYIPAISPSIALQWVGGVLCPARAGITVAVHESLSGDSVDAMQSMQCVEQLLVYNLPISGLARAQQLLDALGRSSAAGPDSPISPTFPSLRTLKLSGWEMGLDPIITMVRKRFSEASGRDTADRVPDLSLDISLSDWVWTRCYGPDSIWTLAVVQGIRAMPGVKGVRLGQVAETFRPGILAVVWDEELLAPVWG